MVWTGPVQGPDPASELPHMPRPGFLATAFAATLSLGLAAPAFGQAIDILHSSDGESQLINAGPGFGGVARFKTLADTLRADAIAAGGDSVLISAGDSYIPSPEFNASLDNGVPFFDGIALDAIGFDALIIGNHEFDLGPGVFRDFIDSTTNVPYLSANLDFSGEPALASLVGSRIFSSTVVNRGGEDIGIIGVTTDNLPFISSPGGVSVDSAIIALVQAEVDALRGSGVERIIVCGHLQGLSEQESLAEALTGVDVHISGGGGELLANDGDALIGDDTSDGAYPRTVTDPDGRTVYVLSTGGDYKYIGRLRVEFDAAGEITSIDPISGPVRVAETDGITADATVQADVVDPVVAYVEGLATTFIADLEVELDGRRPEIRGRETNQGNLITDSFIWQANEVVADFGLPPVQVALANGGGIRNDSIIQTGPFSVLETFNMLPFSNNLSVFPNLPAETLLEVLENAYSRIDVPGEPNPGGTGRFAQISGMRVLYNVDVLPTEGRVRRVVLDDGTVIVADGQVVKGAPAVTLATVDFLARGGDEYPFGDAPFTIVGFSYQRALENFVSADTGLGGFITAEDYPVGGEGRINKTRRDLDGSGMVDFADLLAVIDAFGPCENCFEDLDGDGAVTFEELLEIISNWG